MAAEIRATILTIEDDPFLRANIATFLEDAGFEVLQAESGRAGLDAYRKAGPDLVLLDLRLPEMDGLQVLERIREDSDATPVIIVSGMGMIQDVVASLRLGAWDYVTKPIEDMEVLLHVVRAALERAGLRKENREYQEHLEDLVARRTRDLEAANEELEVLRGRLELENAYLREEIFPPTMTGPFVGRSAALGAVLREIDKVAPVDANVLITGETGTGKELVARAIHERSGRRERSLIKVNCASIPRDLFESECFGHVKGSFTGAVRDRVGRFQLADRSTLFLDEIGEIPLDLQGKLLRVLQDGEYERVGEEQTRKADARIIAATNRNLMREVEAGRFREDLYYRISVYPIHVPPLRGRVDDIVPLAAHFLAQACREMGFPAPALTRRHVLALEAYDWPGNVRELQNLIERAAITSRGGPLRIGLPEDDGARLGPGADADAAGPSPESAPPDVLPEAEVRRRERENILAALEAAGWKISGAGGAAELLGIKPTTLASRMKTMRIARPRRG